MTIKSAMKPIHVSLYALLFAATACDDTEPTADDAELEADADEITDEAVAAAADLIELGDIAAVAPPPGTSVWSEILYTDGTTRQFRLHTTLDGEVILEDQADDHDMLHHPELSALPPGETMALDPCNDDAYVHMGWHWEQKLRWYFHAGSTPSELTADDAEAAIKAGTSNVTNSTNSCGMADEVGATHEYLGRKSKNANISTAGNCLSRDSVNMVSFGDLPKGILATACVWFNGDHVALEGDIQLNKADFSWTTNPSSGSCSGRFSVKAVMTHERGHTFGLDHVSEGTHGKLTMSPSINGPCQDSESTLGAGDVLGLRSLY